jgi:20S proteasome alpha/beta subunit
MRSNLELMALNTNRKPRVSTVMTRLQQLLFNHQGHIGAHLIVGGVDAKGPQLCMISNNG